jgi:hypothetical protein
MATTAAIPPPSGAPIAGRRPSHLGAGVVVSLAVTAVVAQLIALRATRNGVGTMLGVVWIGEAVAIVLGSLAIVRVATRRATKRRELSRRQLDELVTDLRVVADADPLDGLFDRRRLPERMDDVDRHHPVLTVTIAALGDAVRTWPDDRSMTLFESSLTHELGPDDVVARFGAREFLVVLPGVDSGGVAATLGRVRASFADQLAAAGLVPVGIAAGIASRIDDTSLVDLVARADGQLRTRRRHAEAIGSGAASDPG